MRKKSDFFGVIKSDLHNPILKTRLFGLTCTGHIWTFRAKNTPKSDLFKVKNIAQTTSEQPQTNFQKVRKTTFLTLEIFKMTPSESQILT